MLNYMERKKKGSALAVRIRKVIRGHMTLRRSYEYNKIQTNIMTINYVV